MVPVRNFKLLEKQEPEKKGISRATVNEKSSWLYAAVLVLTVIVAESLDKKEW